MHPTSLEYSGNTVPKLLQNQSLYCTCFVYRLEQPFAKNRVALTAFGVAVGTKIRRSGRKIFRRLAFVEGVGVLLLYNGISRILYQNTVLYMQLEGTEDTMFAQGDQYFTPFSKKVKRFFSGQR